MRLSRPPDASQIGAGPRARELAEQEPPQHRDEPDADELPAPVSDARDVDDGRGGEEQRERQRHDDERDELDADVPHAALEASAARAAVGEERAHVAI